MERCGHWEALRHLPAHWFHPSPVQNCTVWWGRNPNADISTPSHMSLMVVTEMVQQNEATRHVSTKELCFEQYSCSEQDVPCCQCADGGKLFPATLLTTTPQKCILLGEERRRQAMYDLQRNIGHPLNNLYALDIQLSHQTLARRYFTCNRRVVQPIGSQRCKFSQYFD